MLVEARRAPAVVSPQRINGEAVVSVEVEYVGNFRYIFYRLASGSTVVHRWRRASVSGISVYDRS